MHHVGKSEFQRVNTYHYFLQTITSLNSETSVTCPFPTIAAALNWTLPTTNFLSDAVNAIFFATCYSTIINLQRYGNMWYMGLLIFYSSFTHISLSSSPLAIQYSPSPSPSPSPLSHSLSSSLFPVALFSSLLLYFLVVIFDCDRCGRRSLGCGSLLSVLYLGELTEPFRLIRE